jgi:hypothetical protein
LRFERQMFPFIPHGQEIALEAMTILFGVHDELGDDCPGFEDCPCPQTRRRAACEIEIRHHADRNEAAETIACYASGEWPHLYCGVFAAGITLGDSRQHGEIDIRFGAGACDIGPVFLLCRYATGHQIGPDQPSSSRGFRGAGQRIDRPRDLILRAATLS